MLVQDTFSCCTKLPPVGSCMHVVAIINEVNMAPQHCRTPGGGGGCSVPPPPRRRYLKNTGFVDTISTVLRDLRFSLNQPLKSSND
jgi:hypothetical protein